MLIFARCSSHRNMLGLPRLWRDTMPVSSGGGPTDPAGGERPPAGQSPSGHWITRWQTVLVAVVTAASAITVAIVSAQGKDDAVTPIVPATTPAVPLSTTTQPVQLTPEIKSVQYLS